MTTSSGLLAIWNDIAAGAEAEFRRWHSSEHMPERMGVPGFRRGRRLFNAEASPRWLTLYETESAAVLSSPAYLARLNAPTPWTRSVLPSFVATERMAARIVHRAAVGRGGFVATIRLWLATPADHASLATELARLVAESGALAGVAAAAAEAPQQTGERALRNGDLAPADALFLLEFGHRPDQPPSPLSIAAERAVTDIYRLEHEVADDDVAGAEAP